MGTAIHIIGGFLGAGKTSAVRHLLESAPKSERIAVIVNDFGEAGIDEALLGETRSLRAIADACVCCTAPEGFVAAVRDLLPSADRIFVEPTGLARASDLIDTLSRAPFAQSLSIGPVITLVDPAPFARKTLPADAIEQITLSDVVVINRIDRCTEAELGELRTFLASLWPGPLRTIETSHGALPLELLDLPRPSRAREHGHHEHRDHDHEHHDHGAAYAALSRIWPPEVIFRRSALEAVLEASSPRLARLKGLFRTDEGTFRLDIAANALQAAPSGWRRDSRVDLIATADRREDLTALLEAIEAARLPEGATSGPEGSLEVSWGSGARLFDGPALRALPGGVEDVSALVPGREGAAARLREVFASLSLGGEREVVVVARDGYITPPVPLSSLDEALIVYALGEAPLPEKSGGPFRLLIPGSRSPCANVKGVVRIAAR